MSATKESVQAVIDRLRLLPHPEGGYFREIYRSGFEMLHRGVPKDKNQKRSAGTSIYYLLPAEEFSSFHRVRWTDELWHFHAGDALELHLIHEDGRHEKRLVTEELERGEPIAIVEAGCWQAARVVAGGEWALMGCSLAPGFDYADFDLPPAAQLIASFPQHERIIRELTKP